MMLITCIDIFMRYVFSKPVIGTYDIVSFLAIITISFSLPYSMVKKTHVEVEIFFIHFSKKLQIIIEIFLHLLAIMLFLLLTWQSIVLAEDLKTANELAPTLQIPFYPLLYAMSVCFLFICIITFINLMDILIMGDKR